jgi:hypothetical protein
MSAQMEFAIHLAAYLTLLHDFLMQPLMTCQFYRTLAFLATFLTAENLFMHQQMIVQLSLQRKVLAAQMARELLRIALLQMRSLVRFQIPHGLAANMTDLPISRMRVHDVHENVRFQLKLFTAIIAYEVLLDRSVRAYSVPLQTQEPLKFQSAEVTLVNLRVDLFVNVQLTRFCIRFRTKIAFIDTLVHSIHMFLQ